MGVCVCVGVGVCVCVCDRERGGGSSFFTRAVEHIKRHQRKGREVERAGVGGGRGLPCSPVPLQRAWSRVADIEISHSVSTSPWTHRSSLSLLPSFIWTLFYFLPAWTTALPPLGPHCRR